MAERYDNDRWRGDQDVDRDRAPRSSDRNRGERGMMSRGADEVRSWFGDERAERRREVDERRDRANEWREGPRWTGERSRTSAIGREWNGRSSEAAWEDGGRTASQSSDDPRYDDRGRHDRERFDRNRWGDVDREPQASGESRNRRGYYDSSMGYGDAPAPGSLNPFPYRGPGSFAGRGPKNFQRSDERIREDVVSRLTDDPRVDAGDVDVKVQNGEVTLSGHVHNRPMRRAAEECVEDLPGVRDVHIELRIGDNAGAIGHPGSQLERDDVTSLNISGAQTHAKR